jgi:epoxyqueuosine reductase
MFFLGEILTDLPLPVDPPTAERCGSCSRCLDACPTGAITGPYQLTRAALHFLPDDRACGPNSGSAPPLLGNRISAATIASLCVRGTSSRARHLCRTSGFAMGWTRRACCNSSPGARRIRFRLAGSAIRRIGHELAAQHRGCARQRASDEGRHCALRGRLDHPSELVRACAVGVGASSGCRHYGARLIAIGSVSIASSV